MRGHRPPSFTALLFAALAASYCSSVALAQSEKTLSGRWQASAMGSAWNVGDWGDACGPRPAGGGAAAGPVTITQQGSELVISGAGRTYSTTECWEQFPGLVRTGHTGGRRGWSTNCSSPPGDPRQTKIVTRVMASDDYITLDETGQYQFVVRGQNCTASVRRSRSFRLIQREGEPAPAPAATASTAAPSTARTTPGCTPTGEPARFEVRPKRKLMRPGEEFLFRALVLDAHGCPMPTAPSWRFRSESAKASLLGPGRVRVADDAPEGDIQLSATVVGRSADVVVEVASNERYEAVLRGGGFTDQGESTEAAVTAIASGSIGGRSTVAEDTAAARRRTFVTIVGSAAFLLGVVGFVLVVRNRRKRRRELHEAAPAALGSPPPPSAEASAKPSAEASAEPKPALRAAMICPTCRDEYPLDAQFCNRDGNRLVPLQLGADTRGPTGGICPVCGQGYDPGVAVCPKHQEDLVPAAVWMAQPFDVAAEQMICPVCGTQYPGDGKFCGSDGAALVPIN